jgi:hypothetical protein
MSLIVEEYMRRLPYIMEEGDINSDAFNNAILIKKCIKDMANKNLLSDFDKSIISLVVSGYNFSEISRLLTVDRSRVSATVKSVTDRIAYILGGEFTDAGLLERLQDIESISESDVSEFFKRGTLRAND